MSETTENAVRVTNDDRRRDKLMREATRAHEWRVQVWAQMQTKIQATNAALAAMGADPYDPWEPNFNDPESVHHYSTMKLSK